MRPISRLPAGADNAPCLLPVQARGRQSFRLIVDAGDTKKGESPGSPLWIQFTGDTYWLNISPRKSSMACQLRFAAFSL